MSYCPWVASIVLLKLVGVVENGAERSMGSEYCLVETGGVVENGAERSIYVAPIRSKHVGDQLLSAHKATRISGSCVPGASPVTVISLGTASGS